MKKKLICRIATVVAASVIAAGAMCLFAGCTSDHPEVVITYTFENVDYAVTYTLSRSTKPETTQHFIELAESGFYDGTIIHNYDANYMSGGAYTIGENGEFTEKDYFSFVKNYEEQSGKKFTQTVYKRDKDGKPIYTEPLYTVVGEFQNNNRPTENGSEYRHSSKGALVMDYATITKSPCDVGLDRADGGKGNNGVPYDVQPYSTNSATSRFYTFLGDSNVAGDESHAVFGAAKNFSKELQPLLDAISAYTDSHSSENFTTEYGDEDYPSPIYLFKLVQGEDPDFTELRNSNIPATDYKIPLKAPIYVRSVTVSKY